jgi:hypothetical protein
VGEQAVGSAIGVEYAVTGTMRTRVHAQDYHCPLDQPAAAAASISLSEMSKFAQTFWTSS